MFLWGHVGGFYGGGSKGAIALHHIGGWVR